MVHDSCQNRELPVRLIIDFPFPDWMSPFDRVVCGEFNGIYRFKFIFF